MLSSFYKSMLVLTLLWLTCCSMAPSTIASELPSLKGLNKLTDKSPPAVLKDFVHRVDKYLTRKPPLSRNELMELHVIKSDLLDKLHDLPLATEEASKAIRLAPDNPELYALRSEYFLRRGIHEDAMKDAENAIELGKNAPGGYLARARCHEAVGSIVSAIRDAEKARDLGSREPLAWFLSAKCELYMNNVSKSLKIAREGLRRHPDDERLSLFIEEVSKSPSLVRQFLMRSKPNINLEATDGR